MDPICIRQRIVWKTDQTFDMTKVILVVKLKSFIFLPQNHVILWVLKWLEHEKEESDA